MAIVIITAAKEHQGTRQQSRWLEEVYKHSYWSVWKKWVSIVAILYNRLTLRWSSILIMKLVAGWVWTFFPFKKDFLDLNLDSPFIRRFPKTLWREQVDFQVDLSAKSNNTSFCGPVCGRFLRPSAVILPFFWHHSFAVQVLSCSKYTKHESEAVTDSRGLTPLIGQLSNTLTAAAIQKPQGG